MVIILTVVAVRLLAPADGPLLTESGSDFPLARAKTVVENCITFALNFDSSYNADTQAARQRGVEMVCPGAAGNRLFSWDGNGANTAVTVNASDPIAPPKDGYATLPVTAWVNGFKPACYLVTVAAAGNRIAISEMPRLAPLSLCPIPERVETFLEIPFPVDETLSKELKPLLVEWFIAFGRSDPIKLASLKADNQPVAGLDGKVTLDALKLDTNYRETQAPTDDQGLVSITVEARGKETAKNGDRRRVIVGVRWRDPDAAMARLVMPYYLTVVRIDNHWFVESMKETKTISQKEGS